MRPPSCRRQYNAGRTFESLPDCPRRPAQTGIAYPSSVIIFPHFHPHPKTEHAEPAPREAIRVVWMPPSSSSFQRPSGEGGGESKGRERNDDVLQRVTAFLYSVGKRETSWALPVLLTPRPPSILVWRPRFPWRFLPARPCPPAATIYAATWRGGLSASAFFLFSPSVSLPRFSVSDRCRPIECPTSLKRRRYSQRSMRAMQTRVRSGPSQ